MKLKLKKIGLRNIKTSIAVFICLFVYKLIGDRDPFYACVASIICMQSTLESSKRAAFDRMIGTFIGGATGIIFLLIDKSWFLERYTYLLIAMGIIPVIYLCNILNRGAAVPITCIVFISILLYHRDSSNSYVYALNRIMDTGFGIISCMLVNIYVRTPKFLNRSKNENAIS